MTLEERLRDVFVKALDLEPGIDPATLQYRDHPNWDSLGHMTLIVAMENEFGIEIEPDQLIRIDSFDAAVDTLRELGVKGVKD